jgi:hypothetical protein
VTPATPRTRQLFVVELWQEPSPDGAAGSWRGIVRHVAHDNERYVAGLSDVTAFIARCIDTAALPGDDGPASDRIRTPR